MHTNADITLYLYNKGAWNRKIIKDVFWNEKRASNIIKSGMQNADSVKILVLYKEELKITPARDFVIKGIVEYEIDTTSEKTISESRKHLQDTYECVTVSTCDKKFYGSLNMQHYTLSCK